MKLRVVFLIILVLLFGCVKNVEDTVDVEKTTIEKLYNDVDQAILTKDFAKAKNLILEVKDQAKTAAFYKRIITGDANIDNAEDYEVEINTPGFIDDPLLKDDLLKTLDEYLDEIYSYTTLFSSDQRSYINVLAVTSYDILRENNFSRDAVTSFLSNFIREMNSKTNYTDFNVVADSISETDAIKIMTDAFDKGDFTDFGKVGNRIDVSFYGIGGPIGSVEFIEMDVQPTQIKLTYTFTRYDYNGAVYAVTTFELNVRYNPASMFGLTILGFQLIN